MRWTSWGSLKVFLGFCWWPKTSGRQPSKGHAKERRHGTRREREYTAVKCTAVGTTVQNLERWVCWDSEATCRRRPVEPVRHLTTIMSMTLTLYNHALLLSLQAMGWVLVSGAQLPSSCHYFTSGIKVICYVFAYVTHIKETVVIVAGEDDVSFGSFRNIGLSPSLWL